MLALRQAIEKGHINANGAAVLDAMSGSPLTLNEAFHYGIFDKRTGVLDKYRLQMVKARLVDAKIYKWNFEDAVKCGIISLKTGKYRHAASGELLAIRDAITRGLVDGDSTVYECPLTGRLCTLKQALLGSESTPPRIYIDDDVEANIRAAAAAAASTSDTDTCPLGIDSDEVLISLEMAFNTRKLFSTFDENTGEIYLAKADKIVPFERAVRKCVNAGAKASTDATAAAACAVRLFDPRSGKELSVHDAIERGIVHRKTGMIVDPKAGNLLSIREAVKRCIVSVSGAPVVTGRHGGYEAPLAITASAADAQLTSAHSQSHLAAGVVEAPVFTSRRLRHAHHQQHHQQRQREDAVSSRSSSSAATVRTASSTGTRRHTSKHSTATRKSSVSSVASSSSKKAFGETNESSSTAARAKRHGGGAASMRSLSSSSGASSSRSRPFDLHTLTVDDGLSGSASLVANYSDPHYITTVKTSEEERRKKISGNEVLESVRGEFKETLFKPGELPKLTAQSQYENAFKSKLDDSATTTTTTAASQPTDTTAPVADNVFKL